MGYRFAVEIVWVEFIVLKSVVCNGITLFSDFQLLIYYSVYE